MVRYRCIGYGTTDGNGVATLNYTGQGVGEVDFVASAESPSEINSSSDVSQPYEVWDCNYFDVGILGQKSNYWYSYGATASTDDTGTTVTFNAGYRQYVPSTEENSSDYTKIKKYTTPQVLEVEILSGTTYIRVYESDNNFKRITVNTGLWKIVVDGTTIKAYKDGTLQSTENFTFSSMDIGFQSTGANSIKYKHFYVYSN